MDERDTVQGVSDVIYRGVAVLTGCLLVGVGVNLFILPDKLLDGGMIGIGLLANYYFSWPPGLVMILASLPVYTLVFLYDRKLFFHSFHGMLLSSFFIDVLSPLREIDVFPVPFSAVTGGVLIGAGIGLMLSVGTNTGGTDLLAQFLAIRYGLPVALLIFGIDGLIILGSIEAVGVYRTVFSVITIVTVAITTHHFMGIGRQKAPYEVVGPISHFLRKGRV